MARIGTKGPRRACARATAVNRRLLALALTLASVAVLALAQAGGAAAEASPAGGARPLAESAPKVTQQPVNAEAEEGSGPGFFSTASGSPPPTIQWERSTDGGSTFHPIEGATSSSYVTTNVKLSESGWKFRAVFKNSAGTATSKTVTLTVTAKPVVTQQPVDASTGETHEASFTSKASGTPAPTDRWQESTDGGNTWKDTGATGTTLTLANVNKAMDGWKFRAVFTNSDGTATSEAATLHIIDAPEIGQQPLATTALEGQAAEFRSTATGNPAPTVQWERSTDGGKTFQTITGATSEAYAIPSATLAEDGYRFRATWTNLAGSVTSSAASLTVRTLPKITEQPESQIVLPGGTATFEAQASGHPEPAVQWETSSNGGATFTAVAGATSDTLTISNAQLSESGRLYRAVFKNAAGSATTEVVSLTVSATDYGAYGWGWNRNGQTGTGLSEPTLSLPGAMPHLGFVTQLAAGGKFGLALRAGGTVESWGINANGQLGNVEEVGARTPTLIEHLSGVSEIAAGGMYSLALLSNGTVDSWGAGEAGQLGNGKNMDSEVPIPVGGLTGVKAIAAGEEHSLALLSNGTVMAWGQNEDGQLGTGNENSSNTPVEVKGLSEVTAIAAGGHFSLALLADGTVVAWGADQSFQLGDEDVLKESSEEKGGEEQEGIVSSVPVPVDGLSNVKAIAAGRNHALALLTNGTVMSWGDDTKGELGNGAVELRNDKATPVTGLSGVSAISAGAQLSAAVLPSGNVMAWGENESGSLGIGTTGEPSDVPVQVHNIGQVVGVSAGDGTILAFGEALPVLSSLSPREGALAGGNSVTISGANLGGATAVHFGGTAASSFTVNSGGSITATSPAGTGTVDVTVTTPSGTSGVGAPDRFTYRTPPTVTKLSAKGGPATGGTTLTITGLGFTGATEVTFAGVPATSFTVTGNATITAVSPVGVAGPADVRVTTVGGASPTSKKDQFRYAPVIQEVSPPNGPEAGANTVTVTGVGFPVGTNTVKFKFGKKTSKSAQCTSTSSCSVVVPPASAPGTVDVTAQANKGKSTAGPGDQYTYE